MTKQQQESEPLVIDGKTFIPGTERFANYYKPESGGPWHELRDGAMVKADFSRGPKWWRRLPRFWKVLIVIAAFSWGSWLMVSGASFIAGFATDEAQETVPTPSGSRLLQEQIADAIDQTWTLENKALACANLAASTSIYEYAQGMADVSGLNDLEALVAARGVALFCSR